MKNKLLKSRVLGGVAAILMSSIAFAKQCDLTNMPDTFPIDSDKQSILVTTVCGNEKYEPTTYRLSCIGFTLSTCKMLVTHEGITTKVPITGPQPVGCNDMKATVTVNGKDYKETCTVSDGNIQITLHDYTPGDPNIIMTFSKQE